MLLSVNIQAQQTGAIDAGNRTSFNYRMDLNATYQFTPLLAAEILGNFNSARSYKF